MQLFLNCLSPVSASFTILSAVCLNLLLTTPSHAASPIYWCPDRKGDQQYAGKLEQGCMPLVEKNGANAQTGELPADKPPRDYNVEHLQSDVSAFLKKYRQFLECCKTDISELEQVEELGDEVGELLSSTQAQISNYSLVSRGVMLREMIPTVAKARADLKRLRARLERLSESSRRKGAADFEEAGREARVMREIEDSIERDIRVPPLPGGPKTGAAIGATPAVGPGIGKSPTTGTAIGNEGKTGQEIGMSPRNSSDIGGSGPTGFAIGGTGRAGPSIGESTFNSDSSSNVGSSLQRSTVGSSISDSTVGSTLGSSSIGSNLQDSSVSSSFGSSSVGSTLQDRTSSQ
ncbi:MAG TPA: hypothetical protein VIU63_04380 [Nitrospira sp.]